MENGGDLLTVSNSTTTGSTTTNGSTTTGSTTTGSTTTGARKKRNVESGASETSKKKEEAKTGCPKDFERISDYLCLHFRKDATGVGIFGTFEDSKTYCKGKDSSASVLQFVNAAEASEIWKWLGN